LPSAEVVVPTPSAPAAPSAKPAPQTSARAADDDLAAEQVLVETGRAALGRGDSASALAALDKHVRQFPRGRLAEERDVLRVQALALAGRTDEARALAQTFRARYPKSVFLPVLDDALRSP
jgi:outer membrane protein assembly factor BamD (BamD/ComL family)